MKILFFQWGAFLQKEMEIALRKLNVEYDVFFYQFKDWEKDDEFVEKFSKKLNDCGYDKVLSVNFSPLISRVCEEKGIEYRAWVYDSPIHIRDKRDLSNSHTKVFFFDGGENHLALAPEISCFDKVILSSNERKKYGVDVAFLGKLYKSDFGYLMQPLNDYYRGLLNGFVNAQMKVYGGFFLEELITEQLMEELNEFYKKASGGTFTVTREEMLYACATEVTGRERYLALALLSNRFNVDIYSTDGDERLPKAHFKGYADYYNEMPKVFKGAKININISLKTIKTGIPLRVLDVMACGGMVITNYQEELLEYFVPGQDIVIYENLNDLVEKTKYYLEHEEERKQIAENGHRVILEKFKMEDRMKVLLEG